MEKTNERKAYCAPQCTWLELAEDELMRGTSFESTGSGGGSGHASAGDSGGLSAKSNPFFEEEDENEETGWE
ncbi:hypothetical protein [Prevotella sp. oral taxon 306]|uniref:hypothetical protein n=1 Tax=Prevotella sp. oral taxon 306 TaxID=712461 RepID=UPI0003066A65|nr:hypothetical protein [Prevotella sp. oral taxon 306]